MTRRVILREVGLFDCVTERAWQATVIGAIKIRFPAASIYHTWRSDHSPSGFPDIVAIVPLPGGGACILAWECKREKDRTSVARRAAQEAWLDAFRLAGADARVLRPSDVDLMHGILEGLQRQGSYSYAKTQESYVQQQTNRET